MNRDFSDLFAALNEAGARYLLIGAHAVAYYAEPRYTKALDVWVEPTLENAGRVFEALQAFGAPLTGVLPAEFASRGITLQIGVAPNRIDVATAIDGVRFEDAWPNREVTDYGEQRIWVIGPEDLVANKRAAGRPQDLIDLDLLTRHGG